MALQRLLTTTTNTQFVTLRKKIFGLSLQNPSLAGLLSLVKHLVLGLAMKHYSPKVIALLIPSLFLLLVGCASSKSLSWTGDRFMVGQGGVVEKIGGIAFYKTGAPNGKFEILSVIETHHYTGGNILWNASSAGSSLSKASKEAERLGGDAIVLYDTQSMRFGGTGTTPQKSSVNKMFLIVKSISN